MLWPIIPEISSRPPLASRKIILFWSSTRNSLRKYQIFKDLDADTESLAILMHRVPFQRWGLLHLSQVFSRLNIRGSKADVAYSSLSTLSYRQFSQLSWPTTVPEYTIKTSAWQEEEVERIRNEIWEGKNICRPTSFLFSFLCSNRTHCYEVFFWLS